MFLYQEIHIKLCQNYTKTYIYQVLYKSCSIKQIIFNKYYDYILHDPENLIFAPVTIFNFYFALLLVDIIDNIITYSLYTQYYVTRTSTNSSAVSLSRVSRD